MFPFLSIFIQIKYYYVGIMFFWMGFDWVRSKNFAEIKNKIGILYLIGLNECSLLGAPKSGCYNCKESLAEWAN